MSSSRNLLLCLLCAAGTAHSAPVPSDQYELKNRSSCSLDPSMRPPFWPIGWVKPSGSGPVVDLAPQSQPKPVIEEKDVVLTSILLGMPSFAVINGRTYMEGEFVRFPKSSPLAGTRPRVSLIRDGFVRLQVGGQLLEIKLRRSEPVFKKNEEELLNDAR